MDVAIAAEDDDFILIDAEDDFFDALAETVERPDCSSVRPRR